jgi:DNA-binding NarL/FixJ family response regulator
VSAQPVQVLVLYSHALMGEGLERMLRDEVEVEVAVTAVDVASPGAVEAALATHPRVIVVEEGGGIDAVEVARRSTCALVLDVDITTTSAWTLRRESLSSQPDEFLAAIRSAVAEPPDDGPAAADRRAPRDPANPALRSAAIPG